MDWKPLPHTQFFNNNLYRFIDDVKERCGHEVYYLIMTNLRECIGTNTSTNRHFDHKNWIPYC